MMHIFTTPRWRETVKVNYTSSNNTVNTLCTSWWYRNNINTSNVKSKQNVLDLIFKQSIP